MPFIHKPARPFDWRLCMPLRIAFWNVNIGTTSHDERRGVLEEWVGDMDLDVLFLEEVGSTLGPETLGAPSTRLLLDLEIQGLTGMTPLLWVATPTVDVTMSTKNL